MREFLEDVTENPTVIASSLTGSYAALAAESVPVERLLLVCPTADTGPRRPWLRRLLRSPLLGTGLFNLLVSRPSLAFFDRRDAYADPGRVSRDLLDYQWRTSHQPNARLAPASFVGGQLDPDVDLEAVLGDLDVPDVLLGGRDATITTRAYGRLLADRANRRLVVFDDARLLPHDEHPDEFVGLVTGELPLAQHE